MGTRTTQSKVQAACAEILDYLRDSAERWQDAESMGLEDDPQAAGEFMESGKDLAAALEAHAAGALMPDTSSAGLRMLDVLANESQHLADMDWIARSTPHRRALNLLVHELGFLEKVNPNAQYSRKPQIVRINGIDFEAIA